MSLNALYEELALDYGTPLYLFDKDAAVSRVRTIQEKLPKNAKLCYAIKANAFLLDMLKDENILFEVCSSGELSICEKYKVAPEKIVFSGVMKTQKDVLRAYNLKVNTITVESKNHFEYLINAAEKGDKHNQDFIIRLTSGNQFGMSKSDVYDCLEELEKLADKNLNLHFRGIHFFTGTQKKLKKIEEEIKFIESFCDELKEKTETDFNSIEYGPGIGYNYFSAKDESNNFEDLDAFSSLIKDSKYNYVVELGRFIASPCGKYITKIMDIKTDSDSESGKELRYAIIDGGINHINYYGQMMGMKNPKVELSSESDDEAEKQDYTIAGSLCTTADVVLRKLSLASPSAGDLLVFSDIGAYSVTEGIYLFLSHALPAVVMKENGTFTPLRRHEETYKLNS